ncbi:MAG: type II toxin-antitoxin system RelE/ParE family toxin [Stellaceae bacterium]
MSAQENLALYTALPYISVVVKPLISVIETSPYLADANRLLSEEERIRVVDLLAADPEAGDLIRGGGGVRKVRIPMAGRGKRGGGRVIYYFHSRIMPVFLLAMFAKNERDDLSDADVRVLAKAVKSYAKQFGGSS